MPHQPVLETGALPVELPPHGRFDDVGGTSGDSTRDLPDL